MDSAERVDIAIRPFRLDDRPVLLAARDAEVLRWLGPGSPAPSPTAVIVLGADIVGWVDAGTEPPWLRPGEVNIGYAVFPDYRGRGYASAGVRLLLAAPALRRRASVAVFVIDRGNAASIAVAHAAGALPVDHPAAAVHPGSAVFAAAIG